MHEEWARQEMNGAAVGDRRSRRSLAELCARLAAQPQASFSAACGPAGRQAARRLFRRPDTSVQALLTGHYAQTAQRAAAHSLILVAQDTTSFDFSAHPTVTGRGPIDAHPQRHGLLAHAALALTPAGEPLGLLHLACWRRSVAAHGTTRTRRQRHPSEKESQKWGAGLAGVEAAWPTSPTAPTVLLIQDREGDVFAFLAAPRRPRTHLLIRAAQARKVQVPGTTPDPTSASSGTLLAVAAAAPVVGQLTVTVAAKRGREERTAVLTLRATAVTLLPPRHAKAGEPREPQLVWVVRATEVHPPAGEAGLDWVLVSTLPIADETGARQLVQYYALRWRIERLHYTLKSGCEVEELQHDTAEALEKALALYYVVAWRLLWLTYTARATPERPAAELLAPEEVAVLRRATKQAVETAPQAVRAIARLAGWRGYRSAPDPGVKMLWQGLRRLTDLVEGWRLATSQPPEAIQA